MSDEFAEIVWIGDQAVVFGYDSDGALRKRELNGNEMAEVLDLQDRQNAAEQRLLNRLLYRQKEAA